MNCKLYDERVGYYEVAGTRYDNKWDAMLHATSLKTSYTWDFAPEIFSNINWSTPIPFSLDELYQRRLQQLRDQYDHLILFFSGGKDSLNILMTAINSGILLDEIVVYYPFAMEKLFNNRELDSDNLYSEVEFAAKPILKKLQMENKLDIRTKIRFQDIGDTTNEFTKRDDWFDQIRPANTLQMVSPSNGGAYDAELIKLALQGKRTAVITGADKPRIVQIGDAFYFTFIDVSFNSIPRPKSTEMKSQYDFIHYEAFYQTPFLPELVVKQAQVIAAAYDCNSNLRNLNAHPNHKDFNIMVSEKERMIATYLYSDGIYPWQTMKHKKHLYRRGEKVVWQTMNREVKDNYLNTVKSVVKNINPDFFVNKDYIQGPVPCITKPYFVQRATYKGN
jgi:hypothetical protein